MRLLDLGRVLEQPTQLDGTEVRRDRKSADLLLVGNDHLKREVEVSVKNPRVFQSGMLLPGAITLRASAPLSVDSANRRTTSLVRVSDHTMALWRGFPVVRSQTTAVSLWLVIPMPMFHGNNEKEPCEVYVSEVGVVSQNLTVRPEFEWLFGLPFKLLA